MNAMLHSNLGIMFPCINFILYRFVVMSIILVNWIRSFNFYSWIYFLWCSKVVWNRKWWHELIQKGLLTNILTHYAGVMNFVPSSGPVFGDSISTSPHLAAVNFTGSVGWVVITYNITDLSKRAAIYCRLITCLLYNIHLICMHPPHSCASDSSF